MTLSFEADAAFHIFGYAAVEVTDAIDREEIRQENPVQPRENPQPAIIQTAPNGWDSAHLRTEQKCIEDALSQGTIEQRFTLFSQPDTMKNRFDFLSLDTATGNSTDIMYFNITADDIMVIVPPGPTSFTRAVRNQHSLLTTLDPDSTSAPGTRHIAIGLTNVPNGILTQNDAPGFWQQRITAYNDQPAASHRQSAQAVF